ncbi:MAG TPA: hypothetical protein VMB80_15260 [Candidatus Acidoferrum sp.]|nr:hypothetical protein [Candidatus Acidoferrum sp.]
MRAAIPTDLLLRLVNATPEQYAAVERILGAAVGESPAPATEDVARQVFALVKELEEDGRWRKASILRVFQLYCVECLPVIKVARWCGCSKSLVFVRLKQLRQKLGRDPAELRQLSSQFEQIEDSIRDPRAEGIYRKGLVEEDDPDDPD